MGKYKVIRPILKDGKPYEVGGNIDLTDEEAETLEASGAIEAKNNSQEDAEIPRLDLARAAMGRMIDTGTDLTSSGKPKTEAIIAAVAEQGVTITLTAKERDALFDAMFAPKS